MQALSRITKKTIQLDVKQIFRKRIQLGSMINGSSSSYVRLVVMGLLWIVKQIAAKLGQYESVNHPDHDIQNNKKRSREMFNVR